MQKILCFEPYPCFRDAMRFFFPREAVLVPVSSGEKVFQRFEESSNSGKNNINY